MPASTKNKKSKYVPTAWGTEVLEDITVPSGQICQVRRPGVVGLVTAGVLDKIDTLSVIVQDNLQIGANGKVDEVDVESLMKDPTKIIDMLDTVDAIVKFVVVQPPILDPPEDPDDRESGVVYTDMVEIEDKMFLMNYAMGGTRDVESFREESKTALADLATEQDDEGTTVGDSGGS